MMKKLPLIILLALFWTCLNGVYAQKVRKVLMIGLDGTLHTALTSTLAPNINALMQTSWVSTNAQVVAPTWSAGGWSGILTGTSIEKNKAISNSFAGADFENNPSIFKTILEKYPSLRIKSIVGWAPINDSIISQSLATVNRLSYNDLDYIQRDENVAAAALAEINSASAGMVFCHFSYIDHIGHKSGFSILNSAYSTAVTQTDAKVKTLIDAVRNRPTYANEDWLIVIATDHGGTYTAASGSTPSYGTHGSSSNVERNSFIILNNASIAPVAITNTTTPVATASHTEAALTFPGTKTSSSAVSMYGRLPDASTNSKIDFSTDDFTIELRIRMLNSTSANYPPIIANKDLGPGTSKGFCLVWYSGALRFNSGDGTNRSDIVSTIPLTDKKWHTVSIVVNQTAKTVSLFDNGALNAVGTFTTFTKSNLPLCIASDGDGVYSYTGLFQGNITHVRIFKNAISATAVNANWNNDNITTTHPNWNSLIFYNKCNTLSGAKLSGAQVSDGADTDIDIITNSYTLPTALDNVSAGQDTFATPIYSYSIGPTVLEFLGIDRPTNYDGIVLAEVRRDANIIVTLPVKVISFTGTPNLNSVTVKWTVAAEENVNRYEVQRGVSADKFVTISTVKAAGASVYTTTDNSPLTSTSYYRLKVIDNDGQVKYEDPISLNFGLSNQKSIVFPNPIVSNEVNVQLSGYATGKYSYNIVNAMGTLIQSGNINNNGQAHVIKLNASLASGIYILNITNGTTTVQAKFVK